MHHYGLLKLSWEHHHFSSSEIYSCSLTPCSHTCHLNTLGPLPCALLCTIRSMCHIAGMFLYTRFNCSFEIATIWPWMIRSVALLNDDMNSICKTTCLFRICYYEHGWCYKDCCFSDMNYFEQHPHTLSSFMSWIPLSWQLWPQLPSTQTTPLYPSKPSQCEENLTWTQITWAVCPE